MNHFAPGPPVPSFPCVWFHGVDEAMRAWVMENAPEAQYSLRRQGDCRLACYSADYLRRLAADYEQNIATQSRAIVCLQEVCCDSFLDLLRLNVRHIIYPEAPFASEAIRLAINSGFRANGPPKPFHSVDSDQVTDMKDWSVRRRDDVDRILAEVVEFFEHYNHPASRANGAALAVKEAITNCIFHAFRQPGSHERRYEPEDFMELDQADRVDIRAGCGDEMIIVSISDNAGTLSALRLGNSLDRQKSERGLMDSRGRGFYLMGQIADRTVIVLQKGEATTVELFFLKEPAEVQARAMSLRHFELLEFDPEE